MNLFFGAAIIGIALLYGLALYVHVSYLMWKLHHYEFRRGRCSRILYFLVILCFTALHVDQILGDMYNGFIKGQSLYMVDKDKKPWQKMEIVVTYFFQLPYILTCFAIVKYRNTKDVL